MRLIDVDAFMAAYGMAERCEDCRSNSKECEYSDFTRRDICGWLDDAPTVDAAPIVHGRWDDSFDNITPYCSVCHMSNRCLNRTPNYCPHCGAKMDLKED